MGKKLTKESFILRCREIHGWKYDYSKVNYINAEKDIIIICPEHGEFITTPLRHLYQKQGCPKCAGRHRTQEDIINLFKEAHGNYYDYSKVVFTKMNSDVIITCPIHGDFKQTPTKHIRGQNCPKCAKIEGGKKQRITQNEFEERAIAIHNNKYQYKDVAKASHDKITIICPIHGDFTQFVYDHLNGHGCPRCAKLTSQPEEEIYNFLLGFFNEDELEKRNRSALNGKEIDIYIPSLKIGIEYNGLYWHSDSINHEKYHLYDKMILCENKGIHLLQIFEDEYVNHKEIVLKKICHILRINKNLPKIMARKCTVNIISKDVAKEFLNKNHIQGYAPGTIYIGAYYNNVLAGVMSFIREEQDKWNLNRFASNNEYICSGIAGKLFNFFIKNYNPTEVKSFADRRWTNINNNLYIKMGFKEDKIIQPDYRYIKTSNPKERIHKFNFRKEKLSKKYNLNIALTEKQMTQQLGYSRIYDCGLIKYIWIKE